MSASGLCQICQSAEFDDSCDRCGQLVCEDHIDEETHLCSECIAEHGKPAGRDPVEDDEDLPDGVGTYEF